MGDRTRRLAERLGGKSWSGIVALAMVVVAHGGGLLIAAMVFDRGWLAVLWGLALLALGALVGFLFGIPRVLQRTSLDPPEPAPSTGGAGEQDRGYRLLMNTNLEQVSDWLTKIIVGVGLVELHSIPSTLRDGSEYVAGGLGVADSSTAMTLLVYFPVAGFLGTYVVMRLYLTAAFSRADQLAQTPIFDKLRDETRRAGSGPASTERGEPSSQEIENAEKLGKLSLQLDDDVLRKQVDELAREYERVRASMRSGGARTATMQSVVAKMKVLGFVAAQLLPELMASASPGARLCAIASLQINPAPEHLEWLAQRFGSEVPFVVYQAAVALLAAAKRLPDHRAEVLAAIDAAQNLTSAAPDSDTKRTLTAARQAATANP